MVGNFVANEQIIEIILKETEKLFKNKGSMIAISGASGFGKSTLIAELIPYFAESGKFNVSFAEGHSPVGNLNIGNLQPLYIFQQVLQNLITDAANISTKKKQLAIQIGLNALSAVPILGEALYFYKETKRDIEKFTSGGKFNQQSEEILKKITEFTKKKPLVILIDDMHFADAESVKAIDEYFLKITQHLPILIIFTFKQEFLDTNIGPMNAFITNNKSNSNLINLEMDYIKLKDVYSLAKLNFKNYIKNDEFEEWIFEHSYGNPGICTEYLRYFSEHSPFDNKGNLLTNFKGNEYLPASVQQVFSQHISNLNEEDKNILSICSVEGIEFSATLISRLLNLDILSTIKKLRSIQQKTGFIKSLGASNTYYGVKTTKYKFTQTFYHSYFRDLLEYEENASIHGQIKHFLKEIFDNSKSDDLKEQLAPYIAAHSSASGDNQTTNEMLLITAEAAKKAGNDEIIRTVFSGITDLQNTEIDDLDDSSRSFVEKLKNSLKNEENSENNEFSGVGGDTLLDNSIVDFQMIRKVIVNEFNIGNIETALDKAVKFYNDYKANLTNIQIAQLDCLIAKCLMANNSYENAANYLNEAETIINETPEQFTSFIVYNSLAQLRYLQNSNSSADNYLGKAVKVAIHLPQELKLMALANLSVLTKKHNFQKAEQYKNAVIKLSKDLKFNRFMKEFEQIYSNN